MTFIDLLVLFFCFRYCDLLNYSADRIVEVFETCSLTSISLESATDPVSICLFLNDNFR